MTRSIDCTPLSIRKQTILQYTKLEPTTAKVLVLSFLIELSEEHDVDDAVFLVDGSHSLQDAYQRHGFDFRDEKHGNRNATERIFRGTIH